MELLKDKSGYILPFVLFVSFLVTTLLLGILSYMYFVNKINIKQINKKKLDLACYTAVQRFILEGKSETGDLRLEVRGQWSEGGNKSLIAGGQNSDAKIYLIDSLEVQLEKKQKGMFWELTVSTSNGRDSSRITYLLANTIFSPFDNAIIMSRPNMKPIVTGITKITGDILSTENEIRVDRLPGIQPASNNYLDGKLITSKDIESKIFNDSLVKSIFNFNIPAESANHIENLTLNETNIEQVVKLKNLNITGDLRVEGNLSDKKNYMETVKFFVKGFTTISSNTISDVDIEIISDSNINIGSNVKLENIILTSNNNININENSYFRNTQLFSRENIIVNKSQFDYPSILLVYVDASEEKNYNNILEINSSVINGSVMLVSSVTGLTNNKSKLNIDKNSKVQGMLYSENFLECTGAVNGIIYTYAFYYYKEPTEYINWLVNVNVNREELDKSFLIPVGLKNNTDLEVLNESWIY